MMMQQIIRCLFLFPLILGFLMTGCATMSHRAGQVMATPEMDGSSMPPYKVGGPYKVMGKTYYPREDFSYIRTGVASWYGKDFHGRRTANGEIYNRWDMTAAHKTLPMPTLVEVTNLRNGRTIVVRINDRGPFVDGRIIDLSERAATTLGFVDQGTTPVKVRVLAGESASLISTLPKKADASRRYDARKPTSGNKQPYTVTNPQAGRPVSQGLSVRQGLEGHQLAPIVVTSRDRVLPLTSSLFPRAEAASIDQNAFMLKPETQLTARTPVKTLPASRPAPKQLAAKTPSSMASLTRGIYLQIGAFKDTKNARRAATIASKKGHSVKVVPLHRPDQTLYRVRVGPFGDRNDPMLDSLRQIYGSEGFDTFVLSTR